MTDEEILAATLGIVKLGEVRFDAQLDGPTVHNIFTVPPGKRAVVLAFAAYKNSASLAGMTDVNLGGGPAAVTPSLLDAESLAALTTANMFKWLWPDVKVTLNGDSSVLAERNCVVEVVAGSTGAAYVNIAAFGFLY